MHTRLPFLPPLLVSVFGSALAFFPTCAQAESFYSGWEQLHDSLATTSQFPIAVATDSRGNVFVTGYQDTGSSKQFYTAKYDALDGHLIWSSPIGAGINTDYRANAIAVDINGDVVVTGSREVTNIDFLTIKYSGADGTVRWSQTYNGPNNGADTALKVATDSAANVIVTGRSVGDSGGNPTGFDITTIKYNGTTGAQIGSIDRYSAAVGNLDDVPAALAVDANNNIIIAGKAAPAAGQARLYVRKLNSSMGLVWSITPINTGDEDGASGVAVDSSGNVVVTGVYKNATNHFGFYTAKLSGSNGSLIWDTGANSPVSADTYGSPRPAPVGVVIGPDDQPIVTGTLLAVGGRRFIRTIKYTSGGSVGVAIPAWTSDDTGTDLGDTSARALATDGSSNTVVIGDTLNSDDNSDVYIAKYDALTGERVFAATYNGSYISSADKGADVKVDPYGNIVPLGDVVLNKGTGIGLRAFATLKLNRFIALTGDSLPDGTAGVADSAIFSIGNGPALSDSGSVIAKATVSAGKTKTNVIFAQGATGSTTFPAVQGQPAPDGTGQTTASSPKFTLFSEPVVAPNGRYAFAAKTTGSSANASGLYTNLSGTLKRVLRQGDAVPNLVPAANLAAIMSYSMRDNELVALIKLAAPATTNTALVRIDMNGTVYPLLRTGVTTFTAGVQRTVKAITTLIAAAASPGDGRWQGDHAVLARVTAVESATNKNPVTALLRVAADGSAILPLVYTSQTATGVDANGTYKSFGLPSVGQAGSKYAFLATLNPKTGSISGTNDTALVYSSTGAAFQSFAREGVASGVSGIDTLPYAGFTDPIINSSGKVAFIATLKSAPGVTVNGSNNRALLFGDPTGTIRKIARLGETAPAPNVEPAEAATKYAAFTSFALSGGQSGAPVFLAKLSGAANGKTNVGLFAVQSDGVSVRRLLRTSDHLGDRVIKTIGFVRIVPQAFGAARSFNANGGVVVTLTFTDKTTGLLHIGAP